jgi:hypothetical protein
MIPPAHLRSGPRARRARLALPLLATLAAVGCVPPPDFPVGKRVVVYSTSNNAPVTGDLEHVSGKWVVIESEEGREVYLPISSVARIDRVDG